MFLRPHLRLVAIAALSTFAFAAHAADVEVSCEKRSIRSTDLDRRQQPRQRFVSRDRQVGHAHGHQRFRDHRRRRGRIRLRQPCRRHRRRRRRDCREFHRRRPRQGLLGQRQRCPCDAGRHGDLPRPQLMSYGTGGIGFLGERRARLTQFLLKCATSTFTMPACALQSFSRQDRLPPWRQVLTPMPLCLRWTRCSARWRNSPSPRACPVRWSRAGCGWLLCPRRGTRTRTCCHIAWSAGLPRPPA